MAPEKLEHDDLILLARLLANHLTGLESPLDRVASKLLNYAERTGEWSAYDQASLPPLNLAVTTPHPYRTRLMFHQVLA